MQFIDERIVFDFNDIIGSWAEGIYRYDVILDNEVIFVGNIYSGSTTPPKIDVTDILRNYYESVKVLTETPTKSKIIRDVTVVLYNRDQTDEESMTDRICFIYRQPNYNSLVTTPILDDFTSQGLYTMPMLQGWDYHGKMGMFIPTYPAVDSNVLSFDMVCGYQNLPFVNDFSVYYNDGAIDKPKYVNVTGNGVYEYSLPLSTLVRGYSEEMVVTPTKTSDYLSYRGDTNWSISDDVHYWRFERYSGKFSNVTEMRVAYNDIVEIIGNQSEYASSGIYRSEYEFTVTKDNLPNNIIVSFYNGTTSLNSLTFVFKTYNFPENYKSVTINVSLLNNRANTPGTIFVINLSIAYEEVSPVCAAKELTMTVFSPTNTNQRYEQTVAKFDSKSRYFLKWRDRYGMAQCQPFKCNHTYSEDITKTTMTNYQNIKKITDVGVNSKWKLNSDWISEKFYPFYESIFISPWLQLYDAKEDKVYSVVLTNTEYTEKTFKNQNRSLFNLELDVELDTKQTILY